MLQQLDQGPVQRRTFLGVEQSVNGRHWVERLDPESARIAQVIAQSSEVSDILARVLAGRGVDAASVEDFLDPALKRLMPDPSSITDMDKAAARIADAVGGGEAIAVFGDYDVDGASSAALLQRFLRSVGRESQIYIPDRIFEGYGPNAAAMKTLAEAGNTLIVCVDCGSTSFEALAEAKQLGLDVVVIDHHQVGTELPDAVAVVNPNRQDDLSGLGHLAAVGVTFLAVVATNRTLRQRGFFKDGRAAPDLLQWLDLVALGTVCDVVPLVGLNRAFVTKGLRAMARRANRGLAALADVARLGGPIAPYHLGFLLGPRINAGGRIGDAALGARLLACDEPSECEAIAAELDRLNRERQALETVMLEEAYAEAEAEIAGGDGPAVLVTASETWHPGIVGLIASRLKDRFQRPAIAIAMRPNGLGSGSGRSIAGVDLGRVVRLAVERGIVTKGGGHAMAAGLTVEKDRLADLRAFIIEAIATPSEPGKAGDLLIDAALSARGVTVEMIEAIDRAGPFGAGHAEPVFVFPHHRIAYADAGTNGHLRLSLAAPDGATLKAIAFRAADTDLGRALLDARGQSLHVAGYLSVDRWQGRAQPSLRVADAAVPDR